MTIGDVMRPLFFVSGLVLLASLFGRIDEQRQMNADLEIRCDTVCAIFDAESFEIEDGACWCITTSGTDQEQVRTRKRVVPPTTITTSQ